MGLQQASGQGALELHPDRDPTQPGMGSLQPGSSSFLVGDRSEL